MVLSRAEIQKRYREKKKCIDREGYLEHARKRMRENYTPVSCLTTEGRININRNTKKRVAKHRLRKMRRVEHNKTQTTPDDSTSICETRTQLIVKLPNLKSKGPKRRHARALAKANALMRTLEAENSKLKRKLKSSQRKTQRLRSPTTASTPRSKTSAQLRHAGLRGPRAEKIRKQLLSSNVVLSEIKERTKCNTAAHKSRIYSTVAGKLVKKYRCVRSLGVETTLCRNRISKSIKKGINFAAKRRDRATTKLRPIVKAFLEREDNCVTMPSKRDCKKVGKAKLQTKILTDYLGNLYRKFLTENVACSLSFSTFCRMRPKNILLVNFLKRNTCLCTRHQNVALKLKCLRSCGIPVTVNPDEFVKNPPSISESDLPELLKFSSWKRVMSNGRRKIKLVDEEISRREFLGMRSVEVKSFGEHIERVKHQYKQLKQPKESLPQNEVIIQMDFSENYTCKGADEIQSAYWNQSQVTLHPIVIYFRHTLTGDLHHKSFVCISNESSHRAPTVLTILEQLFALDIDGLSEVRHIHYWTDSPTSQYTVTNGYSI